MSGFRIASSCRATCLAASCALLAGCGDDPAPEKPRAPGSHVWRGQTDMYFEAKDVAKGVNAQIEAKEAAIDRARRGTP